MKQFTIVVCSLLALACAASALPADFVAPVTIENTRSIQGRIFGGTSATVGQLPWHVWVRSTVGASTITCGGTLIAANWVLTAAHCVQGYTSFLVGAGSNNLNSPLIQLAANYGIVNPSYNPSNYNNDVALLQLATSLTTSSYISPVRLPANSQAATTFVGFQSTVSGFGRLNNSTTVLSTALQVVNMRVLANSICSSVYGTAVVIDNVVCAEGWNLVTHGACLGDSGGPMVIYENGVPTLIGVTSFISGRGCGAGDPTGFARVSRFLTWINAITGIPLRA